MLRRDNEPIDNVCSYSTRSAVDGQAILNYHVPE